MVVIAGYLQELVEKIYHYGVPFVVVLSILVFVHEFGHYWVARRCRVKIDAFSIGFGPELFGWTDRAGTRWRISAIPVGGFVKMFGDGDASSRPDPKIAAAIDPTQRDTAFIYKKLWQKALIVAAGPAANFLFAIVVLAALFVVNGQPFTPAVVGQVKQGSAAEAAGLQPGDKIVAIDGVRVERFEELQQQVLLNTGEPLTLDLQRTGSDLTITATPQLVDERDIFGNVHRIGRLGISPSSDVVIRHEDPATAVWQATRETWVITANTFGAVWQMIIGTRGTEDFGGIISIGQMSGEVWRAGFVPLIQFMVSLSINLGLINLFPVPVLDGGHLLFYGIEALRGRPLGERVLALGFRVGLALVVSLLVFSLWHDVARLMHVSPGT